MPKRLISLTLLLLLIAACAPPSSNFAFSDLPDGNAERGQQLFEQTADTPACATCHRTDDVSTTGPGLGGFSEWAGTRVNGLTAAEYAFQSLDRPASFIVSGFSNVMYSAYGVDLSAQDIADLIAYLMTL